MTAASLFLVAHAHTPALRRASFGSGEDDLDQAGRRAALALAGHAALRKIDGCVSSPAPAAVQTAQSLGQEPTVEPLLADWGYGRWVGRTLHEVAATDPDGLQAWITDPGAAPPHGEALSTLIGRIGGWIDAWTGRGTGLVAVTHAAVIRAAMVHVLQASPAAFWRIDVSPASVVHLRSDGRRCSVRL